MQAVAAARDTGIPPRAQGNRVSVLIMVSTLGYGGAEKHATALAQLLDPDRFEVAVCEVKDGVYPEDGLEPQRRPYVASLGVRRRFAWRAARRLARLIDERRVDVVVCTNGYPLWYALVASRMARRPVRFVEVLHTTIVSTWKSRTVMFLNKLLFRRCDLLVFVSEGQQRYWRERGMRARRDVVIQNGVDVERFTDAYTPAQKAARRAEFGFTAEDYVIGICAGLRPEKAHGDLLRALKRLHDRGVNAKLLIIGDGRERSRIAGQIGDLGLERSAVITGYQADVRPYIASCDVMALASHAIETFSIAALESMSLGKPLVLTRIGGAAEQVKDGVNGYLYEPGDVDALATLLERLAEPQLRRRMGEHAARIVRERFTTARMTQAFAQELAHLAGRWGHQQNTGTVPDWGLPPEKDQGTVHARKVP